LSMVSHSNPFLSRKIFAIMPKIYTDVSKKELHFPESMLE